MKFAGLGLVMLLVILIAVDLYIRFAPGDPAIWHVDPLEAGKPGSEGGYLVRADDGDRVGPVFEATPEALLAAFAAVADAAPRTTRLAGSADDGTITWIARSALWGFPDYISVRAVPATNGARLAVYARLRFGKSDMGVNRDRIEDWMAQLAARLTVR